MKIEKVVEDIQRINGYIGLAILNENSEILYIDEENKGDIDLAFASNIFNDTFYKLNEASLDIGLSTLLRLEVETEKKVVFLLYKSSENSIFTIFNTEGNVPLARIILAKYLRKG